MLLRKLATKNLRLLRDVEIPFEHEGQPRQWTVFIGRNGTGKTTLLQAIALAAAGNAGAQTLADDVREQLPDVRSGGEVSIKAEFQFSGKGLKFGSRPFKPGEEPPTGLHVEIFVPRGRDPLQSVSWYTSQTRPERMAGTEEDDPLVQARARDCNHWFVAGYGMNRYVREPQPGQRPRWPSIDRLRPLFEPVSLIGPNFADILATSMIGEFARLLQQIIKGKAEAPILPGIVGVELRGQGGVRSAQDLMVRDRFVEMVGTTKQKFPATMFAHGHQSTLAWVSDLIGWVLLEAGTAVAPEDMEGIVLIDEIDLYLHPTWQVTFIRALRATFPKLQFIATTHSPILLTGLRREEVVILERDAESGDIKWRHPWRDPRLLTGSELYEEFFEIRDLYPTDLARKLDAYRMLAMNPNRTEEAEQEIDRLEEALRKEGIQVRKRVPRNRSDSEAVP